MTKLSLVVALVVIPITVLIAQVPTDGLRFHYPLNGDISDASGNGENGYAEHMTFGTDRFGNANSAYFNEDGNLSGIVNQTQYNNPQEFTVAYWFKSDNTGDKLNPDAYSVISSFTDGTTGTSFNHDRTVRLGPDGKLVAQVYPGTGVFLTTIESYDDNAWHHVILSLSSTRGFELFVDGNLKDSEPSVTSAQNRNGYWRFGGWMVAGRRSVWFMQFPHRPGLQD